MTDLNLLLGALASALLLISAAAIIGWRKVKVAQHALGAMQDEHQQLLFSHDELLKSMEGLREHLKQSQTDIDRLRAEKESEMQRSHEYETLAREAKVRQEGAEARLAERNAELDTSRIAREKLEEEYRQLSERFAAQVSTQEERDQQYRKQMSLLEEQKTLLAKEFENLAHRIFDEKGKSFSTQSQQSLEHMLNPFREQIKEFRQRVDGIHKENNEAAGSLRKELEHLRRLNQDMTEDAKNLTRALKGDKKKVGAWGEIQLEKTLQLAGLVKGDHYDSQAHFKDESGRNNYPDFVIKLPDDKHMVIDSKVSLVDYDSAIAAEDEESLQAALKAHVQAVKNHIDSLAGKDYSNLPGMRSPSFVLMFMPIEPAYMEAMRQSPELFNYGYQRNVILVSHTTLMPILRTVANLWMVERSNQEARLLSDRAGEVYNQVCLLAERLAKLGGTLQTAGRQYNQTVVALAGQQGLHGKVERFNKLSSKVTKTMPDLEPLHNDLEMERLEVMRVDLPAQEASTEALAKDDDNPAVPKVVSEEN